jgi:hypothetical protein
MQREIKSSCAAGRCASLLHLESGESDLTTTSFSAEKSYCCKKMQWAVKGKISDNIFAA